MGTVQISVAALDSLKAMVEKLQQDNKALSTSLSEILYYMNPLVTFDPETRRNEVNRAYDVKEQCGYF